MRHVLFGQHYSYGRFGLALIGVGMGLHLVSGALNQAALARDRARAAAACWMLAAVCSSPGCSPRVVSDQLLRTEIGYAGATGAAGARPGGRSTGAGAQRVPQPGRSGSARRRPSCAIAP